MDIVASVELSDEGGRLIFRNRHTKSMMFAFDLEKKSDVERIMAMMTVLSQHLETLSQKDVRPKLASRLPQNNALWHQETAWGGRGDE